MSLAVESERLGVGKCRTWGFANASPEHPSLPQRQTLASPEFLLCAGLQLGFEPFQDALHDLLNLKGRARRTSVVPS